MESTETYFIYESDDENSSYRQSHDFYNEEAPERKITKPFGGIVSDSGIKEFVSCFIIFSVIICIYLIFH